MAAVSVTVMTLITVETSVVVAVSVGGTVTVLVVSMPFAAPAARSPGSEWAVVGAERIVVTLAATRTVFKSGISRVTVPLT